MAAEVSLLLGGNHSCCSEYKYSLLMSTVILRTLHWQGVVTYEPLPHFLSSFPFPFPSFTILLVAVLVEEASAPFPITRIPFSDQT